ncbi:acylphosphatase [Aliikangiella marina]|uniref:acylphosphatase n=1 Tax=Aliikangiella marina TaxID=1712262 RepID=A0A545TE41_9GAMM|nr:acylphosphatase [Aliikangiella marina]TQV75470.1 acylphosphatase [Aliikangiella marina]
MIKTVHAFVSGKVQGVWYRDSTIAAAKRFGVQGWVRNLRDGRVELIAQGSSKDVDCLIQWCWQGSAASQVSDVEAAECAAQDLNEGFVRRPTA